MARALPIAIPTDDDTLRVLRRVHVNVPWKRMDEFFDLIMAHRMNVEIGFGGAEMDEADPREIERTAQALRDNGCRISLHGPFWGIEPGCLDPRVRDLAADRISQFMDLAVWFQPVRLVCHTGFDPRHHIEYRGFWLEKSHAFWSRMAERAVSLNTVLLIENVWEKDPTFHVDLLERVDSPNFGFCLDVGHQNSFSTTPLLEWVDALAPRLREIHLHDNDGSHDTHWPVGEGNIDFSALFSRLESCNLMPLLTVEPHTQEDLVKTLTGLGPLLEQWNRSDW